MVVLVCGVVYGVLGMVRHVAAQTISIAIFVFLRPLMYTFGELGGGGPVGGGFQG